ncbi:hypothetical protein CCHL11_05690, partial [Colletotrichum chlorophyti]
RSVEKRRTDCSLSRKVTDNDTRGGACLHANNYGQPSVNLQIPRTIERAEELELQVIKTNLKVFGEEHPNTLMSMGSLALTIYNQGR